MVRISLLRKLTIRDLCKTRRKAGFAVRRIALSLVNPSDRNFSVRTGRYCKGVYEYFLKRYAEYCCPVLDTYAYCLMKNHFHFLVRVREIREMHDILGNKGIKKSVRKRLKKRKWSPALVSQQLAHCFNGYTQAVNKKYNRSGVLFKRPFERKNINEDDYFCNALCYIHRNPQLHGFINDFKRYPYSSHSAYLLGKKS